MSGVRLRPAERDLFLSVLDALAAGTATLRGRVIAGGLAADVADIMFDVAARGAGHRLPAMVTELLVNMYRLHPDDAPVSYDAAARVILLEHPALQRRRDEEVEEAAIAAAEAAAENRKLRARGKAEAEQQARRAERAQRKAARVALREAA